MTDGGSAVVTYERREHMRRGKNGEWHTVRAHMVHRGPVVLDDLASTAWGGSLPREERWRRLPTTPNAVCKVCGARIWFFRNEHGGCAFFDALGKPWPKHPCMEAYVIPGSSEAAQQARVRYDAELARAAAEQRKREADERAREARLQAARAAQEHRAKERRAERAAKRAQRDARVAAARAAREQEAEAVSAAKAEGERVRNAAKAAERVAKRERKAAALAEFRKREEAEKLRRAKEDPPAVRTMGWARRAQWGLALMGLIASLYSIPYSWYFLSHPRADERLSATMYFIVVPTCLCLWACWYFLTRVRSRGGCAGFALGVILGPGLMLGAVLANVFLKGMPLLLLPAAIVVAARTHPESKRALAQHKAAHEASRRLSNSA